MGKLLIKRGAVVAILTHGLALSLVLMTLVLSFATTAGHQVAFCTEYCESHGCTHGNRFARFYPLVTSQVNGLYGLAGGLLGSTSWQHYQQINLLVYLVGIGGLLLLLGLYILSGQRLRTQPIQARHWWSFILITPTLVVWLLPGLTSMLFWACVDMCLLVAHLTGHTLYEVYTLGFVFVLPGLAGPMVLLATGKWLIWDRRAVPGLVQATP